MPDTSSDELPDSTILESISENLSHLNKENHLQNNLKCKVKKKKKEQKDVELVNQNMTVTVFS